MPLRKSFLLRIDPALWSELEAWAQNELRSVNGQIEYLLRQAVARRKRALSQDPPAASSSAPPPDSGRSKEGKSEEAK